MKIQNKTSIIENKSNDIYIYGDISDWENSPTSLLDILQEIDKEQPVNLYIASYGGDVNCGLAMYNELKKLKDLTVHIQGFCFSIATVIAMASEKIVMEKGSLFLIHKPLCMTYGNADDLKQTIETLDKTEESILDIYESFSNISRDELKEVMKNEKAMNGQEASAIFKNIVVEEDTMHAKKILKEILNLIEEKKTQARVLNSTGKVEEAKEILNEIKKLRVQEENLRELEELEKLEVLNNGTVIEDKGDIKVGKKVEKTEEEKEREIENRFLDYVKSGKVEFTNEMKESIDKDGGLIVPKDISTKINERKRELNSLKKYVRVEKVNTLTGSRVIEKNADSVPFASIEEGGLFTDVANPEFETVDYKVVKYGGVLDVTRELLEDTKENIKNYLVNWIAKKEVATENKAILTVADTIATTPVAIRTYDDIKTILNTKIDPALLDKTVILTNQSGYNWLDTLKDKQDRYLLKDHITDPNVKTLEGKYTVIVVTDKVLPVKAKKVPFYIGALDEAITHFEREGRSIEMTEFVKWANDKISIKSRMRFDTKAFDKEALVKGEFTQA